MAKATLHVDVEGPDGCDDYIVTVQCALRGAFVFPIHKSSKSLVIEGVSAKSEPQTPPVPVENPPQTADISPGVTLPEDTSALESSLEHSGRRGRKGGRQ